MSRSAATVTLEFRGDTTQVDQVYEAFVRKASKPIVIPLAAGTPGAPAASAPTTFANGGAPGAIPAPAATEAFARQNPAAAQVDAANVRLATAINQQADAVQQATVAARGGGGGGVGPARRGRGTWGPGRAFENALDDLADQELAGGVAVGPQRRAGTFFSRGGLGRYLGPAIAAHEGLNLAQAYVSRDQEEQLAVGPRGAVDLRRQLAAQTRFADAVGSVPIVGQVADLITEIGGGRRATIAQTVQDAAEQDEVTRLRKAGGEYTWQLGNRAAIAAGEGGHEQAYRRLVIGKNEGYRDAKARADEMKNAGDEAGGNRLFTDASQWLESEFKSSMRDLTRSYHVAFTRVARDIPAMARRASGDTRTASRMDLEADIEADVTGEADPGMREIRRQRGEYRLTAYDADLRRTDRSRGQELGFATQAFRRDAEGDEASALRNRQLSRRARELGGVPHDDPNRGAVEELLTAQEAAENRDFQSGRYFRSGALQGQVRVTGLQARGQTFAAQAEAIYTRGTLNKDEAMRSNRTDDAVSQLTIASNELATLRMQLDRQGSGAEFGAGTLAPGGTQGNFPMEDLSKTIQSIDAMTTELQSLTRTLQSAFAEN
jgi:hypothetical protein